MMKLKKSHKNKEYKTMQISSLLPSIVLEVQVNTRMEEK